MNSKKIDMNLAKIDSLKTSNYEKEVIRSAFYNHLNSIPISAQAHRIMRKNGISFLQKSIILKPAQEYNNTQQRKNEYKRTYKPNLAKDLGNLTQDSTQEKIKRVKSNQEPNIYARNKIESNTKSTTYQNTNDTFYTKSNMYEKSYTNINMKSKQIVDIMQKANVLNAESNKLTKQCKEMMAACFKPDELSYNMTKSLIKNIEDSINRNTESLHEFLTPFLEIFDNLNIGAKEEILSRSSELLQTIHNTKDIGENLCIKLSAIRSKSNLQQENYINDYLQDTVEKMEAYLK
ncbi:hypothetical protein LS73_005135 [Helicobacter muridarum]|uniref:Uncharacterized protein n=1 Tax=Helicobacter muridarum TaxID=216 RepID=A0A099U019_9HELI|nr:hypothetical protein [Helicobacter muridarum]TLE00193.1 hypothetical protein LS73_005135 [Helicobacter muridarum]STQ85675.1 Uncharacterised protein [Helicobacter muridarum]